MEKQYNRREFIKNVSYGIGALVIGFPKLAKAEDISVETLLYFLIPRRLRRGEIKN
jgi:hypothetical protein